MTHRVLERLRIDRSRLKKTEKNEKTTGLGESEAEHLSPAVTFNKMFSLLSRVYTSLAPPQAEKQGKPLRFGILGAASIA